MRRLATLPPFWNVRISGSAPRLPISMTLLSEPAIETSLFASDTCRAAQDAPRICPRQ